MLENSQEDVRACHVHLPLHEIGRDGTIRRVKTIKGNPYDRVVKGYQRHDGYLSTTVVTWNGQHKAYLLHRLVAETYLGAAPTGKDQVHHKDHNKQNNSVANLVWVSSKENHIFAAEAGVHRTGSLSRAAKLTQDEVFEMRCLRLQGYSYQSLADQYGVGLVCAYRACKGLRYKDVPMPTSTKTIEKVIVDHPDD